MPQVNLIIADEINPHLTAEEYMDKDEYENELKQVLGDTRAAFDISERDTLIFGEHGLLVGGPSCRLYEGLLCTYVEVSAVLCCSVLARHATSQLPLVCYFTAVLLYVCRCSVLPPLQYVGMDLFVRNFFSRLFVIQDDMKVVRCMRPCRVRRRCRPHAAPTLHRPRLPA